MSVYNLCKVKISSGTYWHKHYFIYLLGCLAQSMWWSIGRKTSCLDTSSWMAAIRWSSGNAQKFLTSFQSHKSLWRTVWREVSRWKKSSRYTTHMSHATTNVIVVVLIQRNNVLLLQEGNIFIADYELMDGVTANATDPCTLQYLAAPICLLYKNSQNKIMPVAIQVQYLHLKTITYTGNLPDSTMFSQHNVW